MHVCYGAITKHQCWQLLFTTRSSLHHAIKLTQSARQQQHIPRAAMYTPATKSHREQVSSNLHLLSAQSVPQHNKQHNSFFCCCSLAHVYIDVSWLALWKDAQRGAQSMYVMPCRVPSMPQALSSSMPTQSSPAAPHATGPMYLQASHAGSTARQDNESKLAQQPHVATCRCARTSICVAPASLSLLQCVQFP